MESRPNSVSKNQIALQSVKRKGISVNLENLIEKKSQKSKLFLQIITHN